MMFPDIPLHIWTAPEPHQKFHVYVYKHRLKCKYHADTIQSVQNKLLSFITPYAVSTRGLDNKYTVCLTVSWTKGYNFLVLRCVLSFWGKKKGTNIALFGNVIEPLHCSTEIQFIFYIILFHAWIFILGYLLEMSWEGKALSQFDQTISVFSAFWMSFLTKLYC